MKKSKSQEADKFLNLKIHPLHDSDPPPGFRGVWGYQESQVSLQMCSRQQQAALHDEIPYHRTSTSYYSSTLPYIALILKGKECKASSERAQGQRAAHKGRGSHLSTVVPLHICCRLPQRVTNPLSSGPRPVYSQISALVTPFDRIFVVITHRMLL